MVGEQLTHLDIDQRGSIGDRLWSVRTSDGKIGSGKHSRRFTAAMEREGSHFDDGPLSLIGTASVLASAQERREPLDCARFRPNVVLETSEPFVEDSWVGHRLRVGTAVLSVTMRSPRCVMIDMKTADLPAQPGNLKTIGRVNGANLGVIMTCLVPGTINLGDAVQIVGPEPQ
ncbi:MAG: uncharacterized protein QOH48_1261 [Actinomycetota bacterium]|jgi:uncharacterized protein YcbX|nr:uncharacterized protein [Actinomycetota bacterium]